MAESCDKSDESQQMSQIIEIHVEKGQHVFSKMFKQHHVF